MWIIVDIAVLIWLVGIGIGDWRTKQISVVQLLPMSICLVLYVVWRTVGTDEWLTHVVGCGVGGVFLLVSRWSNEKLGYGDSVVLAILGMYLGIWEFMEVGIWAFVLCFVYMCVGILRHRIQVESGVPFIPFLALAYIVVHMVGHMVEYL